MTSQDYMDFLISYAVENHNNSDRKMKLRSIAGHIRKLEISESHLRSIISDFISVWITIPEDKSELDAWMNEKMEPIIKRMLEHA